MGKARDASGLGGRRAPSAASRVTLLPVWRQGKWDSLPGTDLFRRCWKSYAESDALSGHRLAATAFYPPARCRARGDITHAFSTFEFLDHTTTSLAGAVIEAARQARA